jgi:glycosyltransferase involved in cell wall biosynthesis
MSRLKIALVAHTNAPWTPHYARFFLSRGHEVWLGSFAEDPVAGVQAVRLSSRAYLSGENQHEYFTAAPRLRRLLRDLGPDVVFAPYILSNGLTASLAWRGPLVVSARGGDVLQQGERSNLQAFVQRQIVRRVCRRADAIHAVSAELVSAIESLGIPSHKINMFPVGVDVARFPLASEPTPDADADGELHIICTRKQDHVYENHVLIDALAILRDRGRRFRCSMLAGGPLLEERIRQADELGLADRVDFRGNVAHDEVPGLLASAQIYVSASSSDGTSSSLLEAMASGSFPVISRIAANVDWVEEGRSGLYFAVGDASGLANQLERAMDEPALRADARQRNRARVEADASMQANMSKLERMLIDAAARG